jgi:hypothetical protein
MATVDTSGLKVVLTTKVAGSREKEMARVSASTRTEAYTRDHSKGMLGMAWVLTLSAQRTVAIWAPGKMMLSTEKVPSLGKMEQSFQANGKTENRRLEL